MTYPTCPHDRETWEREPALYSSRCNECNGRPCYECHRYGWSDALIPLVSWMTGLCADCYRQGEERAHVRKNYDDANRRRRQLQEAWDAGFEAGSTWTPSTPNGTPSDPPRNPHHEPTYEETYLLEQNDWLRDEVAP